MESKWIYFKEIENKPKTKVFGIFTKETETKLGEIKWYPGFRKYSFYPIQDTIFETQCLSDIINFLNEINKQHKEKNNG